MKRLVLSVLLLLSGCAMVPPSDMPSRAPASAELATVYLFDATRAPGNAVSAVLVNEQRIGDLERQRYS